MKRKFDAYVLWPLAKKFQNLIVDQSTARDFTVPNKKLICSFLILDPDSMIAHIEPAMYVFGKALDSLKDSSDLTDLEKRAVVQSNVSCHGRGEVRWSQGKVMF